MIKKGTTMADKDDIKELHQRIENLVKSMHENCMTTNNNINLVAIQVAKQESSITAIVTALAAFPRPKERPCPDFCSHLQDHKASDTPAGIRKDFDNHMTYHKEQAELVEKKSMTWYTAVVGLVFMLLMTALQIYLLWTHQIKL